MPRFYREDPQPPGAPIELVRHARQAEFPGAADVGQPLGPAISRAEGQVDLQHRRAFRIVDQHSTGCHPEVRGERILDALQSIGVPYDDRQIAAARSDAEAQGAEIAKNLRDDGVAEVDAQSEIVALIAYLQRLGKHPPPARGPDVALTP